MKRKIIIEIDFDLNGTAEKEIDRRLNRAIKYLYEDGWVTGTTNAIINDWSYTIDEEKQKMITEVTRIVKIDTLDISLKICG